MKYASKKQLGNQETSKATLRAQLITCLNEVTTITVLSNVFEFWKQRNGEFRAGGRAVDLGGPKFEIKYRSRCLQKSKLVDWGGGGKHVDCRSQAPLGTGPE